MYKEVREMSRTDAVEAMYQDMAARHRARFRSIHVCDSVLLKHRDAANRVIQQILKVIEIENRNDVKRPYIQQLIKPGLKFPLPHRVPKGSKKVFAASRPSTFF